jgi:hypothetical protein
MNILLVGNDPLVYAPLLKRMEEEVRIHPLHAGSGAEGLRLACGTGGAGTGLAIIEEELVDMSGFELVRQLMHVNPLINTAVIGSMPAGVFHEAAEGLGVLMQLPPHPGEKDAEALLARFAKISGLMDPEESGAGKL